MEIKSISASQPSFKGYIGKNIQNYVNCTVSKEVHNMVEDANNKMERVNISKIKEIKNLGDLVLYKLRNFAAHLNKKTELDISSTDSLFIRMLFTNPISPSRVHVRDSVVYPNTRYRKGDILVPVNIDISSITKSSKNDLATINKMADCLFEIDPKDIDHFFYTSAESRLERLAKMSTGFWEKFKVKRMAKDLDKYAKNIGMNSSVKNNLEEYFKFAKEAKISKENAIEAKKRRYELNEKIAEKILNS